VETVPQLLESAARWWPDHPMLEFGDRIFTYAEVNADANRFARALTAIGVEPDAAVALLLPSRPVFVTAYYGVMKAGAVVAPLNAMFTPAEVTSMVDYLGATVVVTTPDLAATAVAAAQQTEQAVQVVVWDHKAGSAPEGTTDLYALAAATNAGDPAPSSRPDAVAAIFHTSGTTGRPKGAAQLHANIVLGGRQMVAHSGWRFRSERVVCPLPLFNNFGSTAILNMAVSAVATVVLVERWDSEAVLTAMSAGGARMVGTPTMYIYLLQGHDPNVHGDISLQPCIVGGQTMPVEARQAFEERFGCRLLNLYGATETHALAVTPLHGDYPDGSVGQPIGQGTVHVEDNEGREVAPGVVGELVLGGDTVCAGYWRDPERTAESFGPHGWRSGDLGYRDAAGYVFVVDRKKDLIITGGANIYPAEIEQVLYEHDEVVVAAVIGMPDPAKGEIPKAFVVRKPHAVVTTEELLQFLQCRLAKYKCPREIEFVETLPTSPVGKILKRELRDQVLVRRVGSAESEHRVSAAALPTGGQRTVVRQPI
jgi:long-chain acyl-CoA synthetase